MASVRVSLIDTPSVVALEHGAARKKARRRGEPSPPRTAAPPTDSGTNLGAAIAATLKRRIIAWHYPPDRRLTEEALCREFGVSRSPIREALRLLVAGGFVRRTPSRGYAVRQVNLTEIGELYTVRLALELYVVETLAEQGIDAKRLLPLRRAWEAVRQHPHRPGEELAALDARFHEDLAGLLDNRTLLHQLRTINERLFAIRMLDFEKPGRVESTCLQHLRILARIAAGDSTGARAAMRRNIDSGRINVQTAIKDALARVYLVA